MSTIRISVLTLYKHLLRESKKFSSYNYRTYAVRRIRSAFQENKDEADPVKIKQLLWKGNENLKMIKRQVVISELYSAPKLVIEQSK
ncbi:LYR motif-containing protein 4-like [Antedon mediterranea]|uniref:LYR motif-containing protein 4-like n=1 Tax=Antedon mediterranea TaxID=105859 RepID=UPI003AF7685D